MKSKTVVFVEGDTELNFVRELLLRMYNYQNISLTCLKLRGENMDSVPHPYGVKADQDDFYQIINVGNDSLVSSAIISRSKGLAEAGFNKIIGLRDLYCALTESFKNEKDRSELLKKFVLATRKALFDKMQNDKVFVNLCFAIMEVESWFLGISNLPPYVDNQLSPEELKEKIGFDFDKDPELSYFKPSNELCEIYGLVGKEYDKSNETTNALVSQITSDDLNSLRVDSKCSSFNYFIESLLPTQLLN